MICHRAEFIEPHGLFCCVSEPSERKSDIAVVVLNSGLSPSAGPFRLSTLIAQAANEAGYLAVRVDQSGKGETPARAGATRAQSLRQDYADLLAYLRPQGVTKTILVGLCSGADDALVLARDHSEIVGAILLDGHARRNLRYYLTWAVSKATRLQSWRTAVRMAFRRPRAPASAEEILTIREMLTDSLMEAAYAALLERDGRILAVFTAGVHDYYNHPGQLGANLKRIADTTQLSEVWLADAEHTYPTVAQRARVVQLISEWLQRV